MKVVLEYDPINGQITDASGCLITTWVSLNYLPYNREVKHPMLMVKDLMDSGARPEDIIEMKKQGLFDGGQ